IATAKPSRAKRFAMAAPMPRAPPVTRATFPFDIAIGTPSLMTDNSDCPLQEPRTRISPVQYIAEANAICLGDDDGTAAHPIFFGCRRGAAFHQGGGQG